MNFIVQPTFSALGPDAERHNLTLPGLFATMMGDRILDLPAVRPHQRQALHAFLAQVGALALIRAEREDLSEREEDWADLLRGLTPDHTDDAPWSLVVHDVSKPALMQPPIPEGSVNALKEFEATPDALDMLVTAKAHDLKPMRMTQASPEQWFFALLTRQTMDGFLGAGNYGVSRMNGGFASRPMVGLSPKGAWGGWLRRDLRRLLELRREVRERGEADGYRRHGGLGLLWLAPWDGATQLQPRDLDPYFVEICRRIRLVRQGDQIVARRGGSKVARVAMPKELNGVTGDPWASIDERKSPAKCLTVDGGGFNYRRVAEMIAPLGGARLYRPAPLQEWTKSDGEGDFELVLIATVRGQGGTDGFHERRIPIPSNAARLLAVDPDPVARLARERIEDAATVRRSVLRTGLFVLFQNAPDEMDFGHTPSDRKSGSFLDAFDRDVDRIFFESLFAEFTADGSDAKSAARDAWISTLKTLADEQLARAEEATARSGLRRYSTVAAARNMLDAAFFKRFPKPERMSR